MVRPDRPAAEPGEGLPSRSTERPVPGDTGTSLSPPGAGGEPWPASLDLNRAYYHECIGPLIRTHCPQLGARYAAALIGWGSEVLGNDDVYSRHYGWGPRLVLFLTPADHQAWSGELAAVLHRHVPLRFRGQPTRFTDPTAGLPQPTVDPAAPLQIPITTCDRFLEIYLGLSHSGPLSPQEWLSISEAGLLRLTAGEVYYDGLGELTELRARFAYFPDDVWRCRLAYGWTMLSWSIDLIGLCGARGNVLSARLAAAGSVEQLIHLVFLLNRTYHPRYLKWVHRQFYKLPHLAAEVGLQLEQALAVEPAAVTGLLYPVLDRLIAFQCAAAGLPAVEYRRPSIHDRGFFAYDLGPVIEALQASIGSPLGERAWALGALDQWVLDQDLLLWPAQLRALAAVYDQPDPVRALFERGPLEHFL